MTVQYGPWIAFNPGDTPPAGDVKVQAQGMNEARCDIDESDIMPSCDFAWSNVIAYRVVKQPVRGEVVLSGVCGKTGSSFSNIWVAKDTHRMTFTTSDDLLIPGTYTGPGRATIKIEVVK